MNLALISSRIFTGNPLQPMAEALLIKSGRIVAVGPNALIEPLIDTNTRVLSLPGRLVTPGFTDGHCHFVNQGIQLQRTDLRGVQSLDACRQKIRQAVNSASPEEWIVGRGWDENQWPDGKTPTRHDLDDISPENPVMMKRVCGHSIWVNSKALAVSGITSGTPDPAGGKIDKAPVTKMPTGIIREVFSLIDCHIPPLTETSYRRAALAAQKEALSYGITSVHSCEGLSEWSVLSALEKENQLKVRVYHLLHPEDLEAADKNHIQPWVPRDRLWFDRIKLYADGSLGAGTAYLHKAYEGEPDNFGIAFLTRKEIEERVSEAYNRNFDVAIHAIGDKAVSNSLEAIQTARGRYLGPHRDRIEHVQLIRPEDLRVFRELNITASVQPVFFPSDKSMAEIKWGENRCRTAYAWKSLLKAGIALQLGSDAPVEPFNPLLGIKAELLRAALTAEESDIWRSHETLTLDECIQGFTSQAAWTARRETDLGAIMPGKLADLTIFHQDLFSLPVMTLDSVSVELTIINGEIVYQKDQSV